MTPCLFYVSYAGFWGQATLPLRDFIGQPGGWSLACGGEDRRPAIFCRVPPSCRARVLTRPTTAPRNTRGRLRLRQRLCGGFLEDAPHFACVAVREIRPLHHEHVGDPFHRIGPGLRAPRAAVSKCAR